MGHTEGFQQVPVADEELILRAIQHIVQDVVEEHHVRRIGGIADGVDVDRRFFLCAKRRKAAEEKKQAHEDAGHEKRRKFHTCKIRKSVGVGKSLLALVSAYQAIIGLPPTEVMGGFWQPGIL